MVTETGPAMREVRCDQGQTVVLVLVLVDELELDAFQENCWSISTV